MYSDGLYLVGIIAIISSVWSRKYPIGGWLVFYIWQVGTGLIATIYSAPAIIAPYNPGIWEGHLFQYLLFSALNLPDLVLSIVLAVLIYWMVHPRRGWKIIAITKYVLILLIIFNLWALLADIYYWKGLIAINAGKLAWASVWFFYFSFSKRVNRVFGKDPEAVF